MAMGQIRAPIHVDEENVKKSEKLTLKADN